MRAGTDKNITHAVELYEEAAALGSVKALNGLGFAYFYGHGDDLPANKVVMVTNERHDLLFMICFSYRQKLFFIF